MEEIDPLNVAHSVVEEQTIPPPQPTPQQQQQPQLMSKEVTPPPHTNKKKRKSIESVCPCCCKPKKLVSESIGRKHFALAIAYDNRFAKLLTRHKVPFDDPDFRLLVCSNCHIVANKALDMAATAHPSVEQFQKDRDGVAAGKRSISRLLIVLSFTEDVDTITMVLNYSLYSFCFSF